jgi:hypothetical protein
MEQPVVPSSSNKSDHDLHSTAKTLNTKVVHQLQADITEGMPGQK